MLMSAMWLIPSSLSEIDDYEAMRKTSLSEYCQASISGFDENDKIDIVIPYEYMPNDKALQNELRSFEKYGLLNVTKTVYVLTATAEIKERMEKEFKVSDQLQFLVNDEIKSFVFKAG